MQVIPEPVLVRPVCNVKRSDTKVSQQEHLLPHGTESEGKDAALLSKVQAVQDTLKQLVGAKEKVAAFTGKVKDVITAIGDFFDRVIAFFRK